MLLIDSDFEAYLAVATNTAEQRRPTLEAALRRSALELTSNPESYGDLETTALVRAALGNKEQAINAAKRAVELYPVSRDALIAPSMLKNLALVYAWTGEKDQAFQTLSALVTTPWGIDEGELRIGPQWDGLRTDPRFQELVGEASKPLAGSSDK